MKQYELKLSWKKFPRMTEEAIVREIPHTYTWNNFIPKRPDEIAPTEKKKSTEYITNLKENSDPSTKDRLCANIYRKGDNNSIEDTVPPMVEFYLVLISS